MRAEETAQQLETDDELSDEEWEPDMDAFLQQVCHVFAPVHGGLFPIDGRSWMISAIP